MFESSHAEGQKWKRMALTGANLPYNQLDPRVTPSPTSRPVQLNGRGLSSAQWQGSILSSMLRLCPELNGRALSSAQWQGSVLSSMLRLCPQLNGRALSSHRVTTLKHWTTRIFFLIFTILGYILIISLTRTGIRSTSRTVSISQRAVTRKNRALIRLEGT